MESGSNFDIENLLENLSKMSVQNFPKFDKKLIHTITRFGGNQSELSSFIIKVRKIKNEYYDRENTTCVQNKIVKNAILAKLYGRAKLVVDTANVREIDDIITVLISKFSDRRDDTSLCFDLFNMRQGNNETVYEFYKRFEKLISIFNNYTYLHITNKDILNDRCDRFQRSALALFTARVKQPYSSLLRHHEVFSLAEAMRIISEYDNINHI